MPIILMMVHSPIKKFKSSMERTKHIMVKSMNLIKEKALEEGVIMKVGSKKASGGDSKCMVSEGLFIRVPTTMLAIL